MLILHTSLFLRTLRKEREIYTLKVLSLSIAFACSVVIILFCWNEFGYDRFHREAASVFRVLRKDEAFNFEGNRYSDRIPPSFYRTLAKSGAFILARRKVMALQAVIIPSSGNDTATAKLFPATLHAADSSIADIFSFKMLDGSLAAYRARPHTALISVTASMSWFGSGHSAGRSFVILAGKDSIRSVVAGVFDDFPNNSHEKVDVFVRYDPTTIRKLSMDPDDFGVYGRFSSASPDLTLIEKANSFFARDSLTVTALGPRDLQISTRHEISYELQPLPDIHFGRRVIGESATHGDLYSILILVCIAALIFILALTNYINLTTLTLPNRSKEIAIKKVAGSGRLSLLLGLALESFLVVAASWILSIAILICAKGVIRTGIPVDIGLLSSERKVLLFSVGGLVTITCVGPLLVTLKFIRASPTKLLSTETITFPRFKKVITVIQLGICLSLLVSAMVVNNQITYSLVKEPGRNKDQVAYLPYPHGLSTNDLHALENRWGKNGANPNIEGVTALSHLPDRITRKKLNSDIYALTADRNFIDFFRVPMVAGRWFGWEDSTGFVINEQAAFRHPEEAAGAIGVMGNLEGVYNQSEKSVEVRQGEGRDFNFLCFRIIEVDVRQTVDFLDRYFHSAHEVKFLDRKFQAWLEYEDRLGSLCGLLAIISGVMALCAIYGLSLSLSNDKIRQVAIHKMLGASLADIIRILMSSFAMPMLVAVLIFGMATYIFLKEWLRNFVYQAHFGALEWAIALSFCVVIIAVTCGRQAIKLAGRNLVGYLKG